MQPRLGCFLVVALSATQYANAQVTRQAGTAPLVRLVHVAPKVQIEVLDWGGHGRPLVFLAGSGDTPHMFDGFAPKFTDEFHVLGITRRGFGGSSGAVPPNNVDTLVSDIRSVLDSLGFTKVTLVGHSYAGEEMTRFGELNPGRCAALIYMDAAYDRTKLVTVLKAQPQPPPPPMRASDSASSAALRSYIARVAGMDLPESEILATSRFDASGRFVAKVTPDSLEGRLYEAFTTPRYDRVQCRSVAIYNVPDSAVDLLPYYPELDSAGRAQADSWFKPVQQFVTDSPVLFSQGGRNQVVRLSRSRHYVFLDRPTEVARAIRGFLGRGP
jgi:pimeloyl-ACP methyl ester carboxylesterase